MYVYFDRLMDVLYVRVYMRVIKKVRYFPFFMIDQ